MLLALLLSLCAGEQWISPGDWFSPRGELFVWQIRLPRTLAVLLVFKFVPLGKRSTPRRSLRITVPESLNYTEAFEEVLAKYASCSELVKVKTTNMGSTFELHYELTLKNTADEKSLIDDVRVRNGNLPVSCSVLSSNNEQL